MCYHLVKNMEIKSINLDNVDENTRAITIKTSENFIETPNRAISTSEINKIKGMRNRADEPPGPFDVVEEEFNWQIYQIPLEYTPKVRQNISEINGLRNKISAVKSKVNIPNNMLEEDEYKNILKLIYPKITQKDKIEIPFMTALMEIQLKANADVIVIPEPYYNSTYEDFVNNIKISIKFLEELDNKKPVMPIVGIKTNKDRFVNKLDYILDQHLNPKKDFGLMGISCKVYGSQFNLHVLRNMSDKFEKYWIHGFDAFRNQAKKTFYNPHAVTIWGIDTVGVTPQGRYIPGVTDAGNIAAGNQELNLRVYTEDSWGIHKGSQAFIENHLCDCDGCDYYRRTTDVDKLQNSLDVHEIIQSHSQIVSSRQNIEENQYLKLVKDKQDFRDYYESSVGDI